jgi:hypothetical protein
MSRATLLIGAVVGGFVLWLAANDRLKVYAGLLGL